LLSAIKTARFSNIKQHKLSLTRTTTPKYLITLDCITKVLFGITRRSETQNKSKLLLKKTAIKKVLENVQKDHKNEAIPFEIVSNESLRLSDFQSRSNRKATKIEIKMIITEIGKNHIK
jgi:hypothetical protein